MNFQISLRVANESLHLQAVVHNPRVGEQFSNLGIVIARHFFGIKLIKGGVIVFAFTQNRDPAEASLSAIQQQFCEQHLVVIHGYAPFFIVIAYI